jgi:hypothetical protein
MKSSPLAQVKDRFKDKDSLVSAVRALATEELWVGRVDEGKGLDCVSNRKLLHLHDVLSEVKKSFGSRKGAIDAILDAEKRTKDAGYRTRLETQPTPRLLDHARAAKRSTATAAPKAPAKAAPVAKAPAKKAAPKKPAAKA